MLDDGSLNPVPRTSRPSTGRVSGPLYVARAWAPGSLGGGPSTARAVSSRPCSAGVRSSRTPAGPLSLGAAHATLLALQSDGQVDRVEEGGEPQLGQVVLAE